jgi:hypothetical protein
MLDHGDRLHVLENANVDNTDTVLDLARGGIRVQEEILL